MSSGDWSQRLADELHKPIIRKFTKRRVISRGVDEIAAYHDICYDMKRNKHDCDKEMIKSLDKIPYGEMTKWGQTARFLINTKQKLGLGVAKKGKRR